MTDIKVLTSHSEYLPLDSMYINPASNAFINVSNIAAQWKPLNFLSPPNYPKAIEEYASFEAILKEHVSDIRYFQKDKNLSLDAMYCRDASIATDHGMILCNMGKAMRSLEPNAQGSVYEAAGIPILGRIEAPGTLEGGDVAWIDTQTLAVGHSYRTNHAGIEQLKGLLNPLGIDVLVVELPHFRGPSDVFHLMSVLSPVDADLAVVYSALMPIKFRNELLERGFELIEVPETEFDTLGSNVLALAPRNCIMVAGNPITEKALLSAACELRTYRGNEISIKGGGGPTCLTRPFKRRL
ncbi:dimethylarginine dimethylaminohydrolase family protein [Muriicola sp.]|uniref:dimethylarginine dimethylaminohydrolase family protein n=1 Tax=Muriicola sp. TaxID=2020856 RepID=UPI003C75FD22